MKNLFAFFAFLLFIFTAVAVETTALNVVGVSDGDTITVETTPGVSAKVRLLYLDTPESKTNRHDVAMPEGQIATKALGELLPKGTRVRLWGPGQKIECDVYGRQLAVILLGDSGWTSAQESMIFQGHTVYWRKYGEAPNPELHQRFLEAEKQAKKDRRGAWATAEKWMTDKSHERTAPQGSKKLAPSKTVDDSPSQTAPQNLLQTENEHGSEFMINAKSGVRHNKNCRYFKSDNNKPCGPSDGKTCKTCGG